jgi:hypothetical protein
LGVRTGKQFVPLEAVQNGLLVDGTFNLSTQAFVNTAKLENTKTVISNRIRNVQTQNLEHCFIAPSLIVFMPAENAVKHANLG